MHNNRPSRGYVLVATLALLVLAATLLAGVGRVALRQVTLAKQAEHDLQLRLGTMSCRKALLPHVESILSRAESQRDRPVPVHRVSIPLTTFRFDLLLSDENAKANVNLLWTQATPANAENRLRQSLAGTGHGARVRLHADPSPAPTTRPTTRPGEQAPTPRVPSRFHAFGQVFDNITPDQLLHRPANRPSLAETFTCWGGGPLNLRRASEPVLRLIASDALTGVQIQEILQTRNQSHAPPITSTQGPRGSPLQQLMRRLIPAVSNGTPRTFPWTESSDCHSLWIVAHDDHRAWYHLAVHDRTDPNADRHGPRLFAW